MVLLLPHSPSSAIVSVRLSGCCLTKANSSLNIIQKSGTLVILKLLDLSYNPLVDVDPRVDQEFLELG